MNGTVNESTQSTTTSMNLYRQIGRRSVSVFNGFDFLAGWVPRSVNIAISAGGYDDDEKFFASHWSSKWRSCLWKFFFFGMVFFPTDILLFLLRSHLNSNIFAFYSKLWATNFSARMYFAQSSTITLNAENQVHCRAVSQLPAGIMPLPREKL